MNSQPDKEQNKDWWQLFLGSRRAVLVRPLYWYRGIGGSGPFGGGPGHGGYDEGVLYEGILKILVANDCLGFCDEELSAAVVVYFAAGEEGIKV